MNKWNRQRASLFALIKKSANAKKDISDQASAMVVACVSSECQAINRQCMNGPSSTSIIFTADVVSPDSIPAGVMVRALAEIVMLSSSTVNHDRTAVPFPNCLRTLTILKGPVLSTISLKCPDPQCCTGTGTFTDPRPTLAEAWFQGMIAIAEYETMNQMLSVDSSEAESLLTETFVAIVSLLFFSSLGKSASERANDPGMSLDGPHTLAIMGFVIAYFRLRSTMLQCAGERLLNIVPVNVESVKNTGGDTSFLGIVVVGAALFRACQGALPPWAIESIPEVYSSFFESVLGSDVEVFGRWLQASMEVRLRSATESNYSFGGLNSGHLLSGRYFESMSHQAKVAFVNEAKQLATSGGGADWRRLKGLIKQACGGKKKDTDFNQKPSPTRWDFDRI
jgi:hypothetical protein